MPSSTWAKNKAVTTKKYLAVARIDGVIVAPASTSACGEPFGRLDVAPPHVEFARIIPDQPADPAEQDEDRNERPQEDRPGRRVADQRLVRPVAGVGDGIAGPIGRGRPRGPEEEARQRMRFIGRQHRILRHCVKLAQLLVGRACGW